MTSPGHDRSRAPARSLPLLRAARQRVADLGSIGLFTLMTGTALWLNDSRSGRGSCSSASDSWSSCSFGWFGTVIGESQDGIYNKQVDTSFRMGMMWFIFSEVMFFAAFFGALFYARELSVPWLGGEGESSSPTCCSGPASRTPGRPTARAVGGPHVEHDAGVGHAGDQHRAPALGGVTITIAHHALRAGKRGALMRSARR